jgi:PAS domain S-box-containing protein
MHFDDQIEFRARGLGFPVRPTPNRHARPKPADGKTRTRHGRSSFAAWWLLLGWLGIALPAGAVPPPPVPLEQEAPWRIANFAKDAGLERRMVFDIAFETNNTAWFAASDGLYRYDSYHWRRFTTADGLPSDFVRSVSVTRDGSIWVGTDRGAGVFDTTSFDRRGTEGRLAGPNVRRIVETSDGALWFCCDRWPDATQPGGLTRLKKGSFREFGMAEGLPSDHLLNLFEQSNGRLIALTANGPATFNGDGWSLLAENGFPAHDHTWAMEETPDGKVFAQAYNATWILADGHWTSCGESGPGANAPFCVTRDGSVIKAVGSGSGGLWFSRYDGRVFTRASAEIADTGLQVFGVRQAPDGAIWGIGRGTLVRWEYLPGIWKWRPDLPSPAFEDRMHRIWFSDHTGTVVKEPGGFRRIPGLYPPLSEGSQGSAWGAGTNGVAHWTGDQLEEIPFSLCGIARLRGGTMEPSGVVWLRGVDQDGGDTLAEFRSGTWRVFGPASLGGRKVRSIAPDPQNGLWAVLNEDTTSSYDLVRITANGIAPAVLDGPKPPTHRPSLCVSRDRLFLYGYNGLWEAPLGDRLRFTRAEAGAGVFTRAATDGEASAFVLQEGPDGRAAILIRRGQEWVRSSLSFGEGLWLNEEGWLTAADGPEFVLCQARSWNNLAHVSLPIDSTITSMVRASEGDFWLGTPQGTLHVQPGAILPDTVLTGPRSLNAGSAETLHAGALTPFTPRTREKRYSFTWRLNSGAWSAYGDWPAGDQPLSHLPPGKHRFEARARDGFGNEDPTPAVLAFEVKPIPVQDRPWFRPALALTGLALALLALALHRTSRRLKRYAGDLETQVRVRTLDLERDVAERRKTEQALRESELRFRAVVQGSQAVIFILDREGVFELSDGLGLKALGLRPGEVVGQSALAMYRDHPVVVEHLQRALSGESTQAVFEVQSLFYDTLLTPRFDTEGRVSGVIGIATDITARKRAEAEEQKLALQLAQARKMESVGRLAGGVAHDFNNMLTVIMGNVGLALGGLSETNSVRDQLQEIEKAAQRSADLTRQLLTFARKQTVSPKVLDLNDAVSGLLKMLRRLIGEQVQLAWQPGSGVWPVKIDPSQLDQMLANLAVNARDAIRGEGKILIETTNRTVSPGQAREIPEALPGDYVRLTIADTGCGMTPEVQSRIFEPFFTTKGLGEGTGLGLATVYGIIKQNQGFITVDSQPGAGSTFGLYLPRVQARVVEAKHPGHQPVQRGTETILVVEDEEPVLEMSSQILRQHGYTVMAARLPEAALKLVEQHQGRMDLLVTDVVMPGMNGRELKERITHLKPGIRCLYTSGYPADVIAHQGILDEGIHFLHKPFTISSLTRRVREVLEKERGEDGHNLPSSPRGTGSEGANA